jgi:hypothetical protein
VHRDVLVEAFVEAPGPLNHDRWFGMGDPMTCPSDKGDLIRLVGRNPQRFKQPAVHGQFPEGQQARVVDEEPIGFVRANVAISIAPTE